jgi:hypothetical protein
MRTNLVGKELVLGERECEGEAGERVVVLAGDVGEALQGRHVLLGDDLAGGRVRGQAGQPEARDALHVGVLLVVLLGSSTFLGALLGSNWAIM